MTYPKIDPTTRIIGALIAWICGVATIAELTLGITAPFVFGPWALIGVILLGFPVTILAALATAFIARDVITGTYH